MYATFSLAPDDMEPSVAIWMDWTPEAVEPSVSLTEMLAELAVQSAVFSHVTVLFPSSLLLIGN
ncbi:hypothetical protein C435_15478 [Haloarcula marismortui ATCC 33799]|uniref:Uncharacterized protein n=1 Tax=Haloarcula marismortui ATCC 33799 TaxID=662475 RepID=M0JZY1_9EURY|nr:hypothetical protein C435_15478 [Haloarcula californiae ATCC 33799]